MEFYECARDMTCEELEQWDVAEAEDSREYPCGEVEAESRATCPGLSLFPGDP